MELYLPSYSLQCLNYTHMVLPPYLYFPNVFPSVDIYTAVISSPFIPFQVSIFLWHKLNFFILLRHIFSVFYHVLSSLWFLVIGRSPLFTFSTWFITLNVVFRSSLSNLPSIVVSFIPFSFFSYCSGCYLNFLFLCEQLPHFLSIFYFKPDHCCYYLPYYLYSCS